MLPYVFIVFEILEEQDPRYHVVNNMIVMKNSYPLHLER